MSILKRGNSYQANIQVRGVRYRKSFKSQEAAETWRAKIIFSIKNDIILPEDSKASSSWTFREASDQCMKIEWVGQKSERTNILNTLQIETFLKEHFNSGDVDLNKINTLLLDDFVVFFQDKGNSDSTINRKLMCLSKIMKFAFDRGKVTKLPKLPLKKEPKGRIRWLTLDEEKLLMEYLDFSWTSDYLDYYVVAVDTGLRTGEMLRLEKKDIINFNKIIVWISKSNKSRDLDLTPRAKKVLLKRTRKLKDNELIFSFPKTKLRYRFDLMRKAIPELFDVHPHVMRHTFCSRLIQLGIPIANVQKLMGHVNILTTMRYAHLAPNHGALDINVLAKYVA